LDDDELLTIASSASKYQPNPTTTDNHLTDMGNAVRFGDMHRGKVKYVHKWNKWLLWTGSHWSLDDRGQIHSLAKETVKTIYNEAALSDDDNQRKAIASWAKSSESRQRIDAMLALAQSEPEIPITPTDLDTHHWYLNCKNGTINLKTGELLPHDPKHLITKCIDVEYDPSAGCPMWKDFLEDIFAPLPDRDAVIAYVKKAIGYSLTGITRQHILHVMYGIGRNGKSTFIRTIARLLGPYAAAMPPKLLMMRRNESHPTELASLHGVRFGYTNESDENERFDEVKIKSLTGGDAISCRRMHEDFWQFNPTHHLWLASNYKPRVNGTDEGIWRRLRLLPFNVQFMSSSEVKYASAEIPDNIPVADECLPEKLAEEMSGILAWCVQGCLLWEKKGLAPPKSVEVATKEYRTSEDVVSGFIEERCEIGATKKVSGGELYRSYKQWCQDNEVRMLNNNAFAEYLTKRQDLGLTRKHLGRARMWVGIGLVKVDMCEEPDDHAAK
jgi:putative DNA primase/helicase